MASTSTVPPGSFTAIVGETGRGKTTLGYLVARLYDVQRRPGHDRRRRRARRELRRPGRGPSGSSPRRPTCSTPACGTTCAYAKPDATDAEIEAAARAAQIHDLIASLPDGYDTVVGERGHRFSGGEKQRIAIARDAAAQPTRPACSTRPPARWTPRPSVPCRTRLRRLGRGRTTITIAHRLSTVRDADQIVVLDHGRVVERGTHEELLEPRRPLRRAGRPGSRRRIPQRRLGMTLRPRIAAIELACDPAPWAALGFAVDARGRCRIGTIELVLAGGDGGITGWALHGAIPADDGIDGLATTVVADPGDDPAPEHPNGVAAIDHLVVNSPDTARTFEALEAAGFELRRVRDAGTAERPLRQGFLPTAEAIVEVVGPPEPEGGGPATFWGLALVAADLDATVARLGEAVGPPREAVQAGRRIATVVRAAGLGVPVALMSPRTPGRP